MITIPVIHIQAVMYGIKTFLTSYEKYFIEADNHPTYIGSYWHTYRAGSSFNNTKDF